MRIQNYLTGIEGVASGSIATINVPTNRRYHQLNIFYGESGAAADATVGIEWIRLTVNGVLMRNVTPAQAISIAKLNLRKWSTNVADPAVGEIPIYFSEPWRASIIGEEATSWPAYVDQGVQTFTMQVKIASGRTAPSLQVLASYDYGRNVSDGKQFVTPIKQLPYNYNVAEGVFDITTLPVNYPIQRIHLFTSAGSIDYVEVYRDSEKVLESTSEQNQRALASHGFDATASGISYPICFDADQQLSSPLVVSRDLDVRVTQVGSAATLTALVEQRANGYV